MVKAINPSISSGKHLYLILKKSWLFWFFTSDRTGTEKIPLQDSEVNEVSISDQIMDSCTNKNSRFYFIESTPPIGV